MNHNESVLSESLTEDKIVDELQFLGWSVLDKSNFQRIDYKEVINNICFLERLKIINPNIEINLLHKAHQEIKNYFDTSIEISNQKFHKWIKEGYKISDPISKRDVSIFLIDEKNPHNNSFEIVRQLEFSNGENSRIPDVILYINGLPLVIMEIKAPTIQKLKDAWKQNESLKRDIPNLFKYNFLMFISSYDVSKYGSMTSSYDRYCKLFDVDTKQTDLNRFHLIFSPKNFLNLLFNYTYWQEEAGKLIKIIAASHQVVAVKKTIKKLKTIVDNKGGTVWHTQGSGKSITMVFLTRKIIRTFEKATIIVLTDRKALDQQIYGVFENAKEFLRNIPVKIKSRDHLIEQLKDKKKFNIYFSTIQKFYEATKQLSNRDDIFVLVDEAHRTQNLDDQEIINQENETIETKYSHAKYLQIAFPYAKLVAFTGTPLIDQFHDTTDHFGDYNDIYSLLDAVYDGFTVPIYYEIRKTKIFLNKTYSEKLDQLQQKYLQSLDPNDRSTKDKEKIFSESPKKKIVLENWNVIEVKLKDILNHYDKRKEVLNGKALIVANTRKAAFRYYQLLKKLNPTLYQKTILVVTGNNKDDDAFAKVRVQDCDLETVAKEFKKTDSKYKIAIVVNRWLTGFDVPDLDVIYIDRLLRMHNLMQAVARVNRVYFNKEQKISKKSGLVVDYIGIWANLSKALLKYSRKKEGIKDNLIVQKDVEDAKKDLLNCLNIINDQHLNEVFNYLNYDKKQKYDYIMKNVENLLKNDDKTKKNRNLFVKICKRLKTLYKITYTILSKDEIVIIKIIFLIRSQIVTTALKKDDHFIVCREKLYQLIEDAVESKAIKIDFQRYQIKKNIFKTAIKIEKEAEELFKSHPQIAVNRIVKVIELKIKQLNFSRPYFTMKIWEKLKEIIERLQEKTNFKKIYDDLIDISKKINQKHTQRLQFPDNAFLQCFFQIVTDDKYLSYHRNSEVLSSIAKDLYKIFKDYFTTEFNSNPTIRNQIRYELIILLKNRYHYPHKEIKEKANLIVDQIQKLINIKGVENV